MRDIIEKFIFKITNKLINTMKRETIWEYKIRVKQEAKETLALAKKQEAERQLKKQQK
jgi:hypothetical protein